MTRAHDSPEVRALLLAREARGLRVPLIARMILVTFAIVTICVSLAYSDEPVPTTILMYLVFGTLTLTLALNGYLLLLLRRGRQVEMVGMVGAVLDALFVFALSVLAQLAGVQDGLPVGYVFQTELPVTVLAIVVVNGLALRPRYPIIVGCGAVAALVVPAYRTVVDPLSRFSDDRLQVYAGSATDFASVVTITGMVVGACLAVSLAANAARVTVRQGITQELDNARLQREQLQVVMREKVRALGKLVAGVSHEINNPIGALRSSVDTQGRLLEKLGELPGADDAQVARMLGIGRQNLGAMRTAADRIAAVEASLRALSHLDEADLQKVDLHRELDSVLATVRRQHRTKTTVELEHGKIPQVYLNASEFNQALLTIITNAFEAAGAEGTVTVRTAQRDDAVVVEVADTGPGISPEQVATLFDVSLGGKGERVAAGLGLATAQSIVQRHGGEISVQSRVGDGATFCIRLPLGSAS